MTEHPMQDPKYLTEVAYRDASRLNARIDFWTKYGKNADQWYSWYFDLFSPPDNARILEVGCGPGGMWEWGVKNEQVSPDWSITLTDLSEGMLQDARSSLEHLDRAFEFGIADVCDLPFDDGAFEVVVANYMLYHASNIHEAISEIARVLAAGGVLYAATNGESHIMEFIDLQRRFALPGKGPIRGAGHDPFTLVNGADLLSPYFLDVAVHVDESIAKADDTDLVLAFAESMEVELDLAATRDYIAGLIESTGYFPVTRASGLFVAKGVR